MGKLPLRPVTPHRPVSRRAQSPGISLDNRCPTCMISVGPRASEILPTLTGAGQLLSTSSKLGKISAASRHPALAMSLHGLHTLAGLASNGSRTSLFGMRICFATLRTRRFRQFRVRRVTAIVIGLILPQTPRHKPLSCRSRLLALGPWDGFFGNSLGEGWEQFLSVPSPFFGMECTRVIRADWASLTSRDKPAFKRPAPKRCTPVLLLFPGRVGKGLGYLPALGVDAAWQIL
jgi:hypothetical protein